MERNEATIRLALLALGAAPDAVLISRRGGATTREQRGEGSGATTREQRGEGSGATTREQRGEGSGATGEKRGRNRAAGGRRTGDEGSFHVAATTGELRGQRSATRRRAEGLLEQQPELEGPCCVATTHDGHSMEVRSGAPVEAGKNAAAADHRAPRFESPARAATDSSYDRQAPQSQVVEGPAPAASSSHGTRAMQLVRPPSARRIAYDDQVQAQQEVRSRTGTDHVVKYYNPAAELVLCNGRVLSYPWREIWEDTPLVIHDKEILSAFTQLGGCASPGNMVDFTGRITNMIDVHPGPISCFRIDSSVWTGRKLQLEKWLQQLSLKRVEYVVILNLGYGSSLEFPLDMIESEFLQHLSLGFFNIQTFDLQSFSYQCLNTLELIGCQFNSDGLYYVIKDCDRIMKLSLGLITSNIKLSSRSLRILRIWKSEIKLLNIEHGPKLQTLFLGARPVKKANCVHMSIQELPALLKIHYLMLRWHTMQDVLHLRNVKTLGIGIDLGDCKQITAMKDVLTVLNALEDLNIWRTDEASLSEGSGIVLDEPFKDFCEITCIRFHLENFTIEDFQGGKVELAMSSAIVKHAKRLSKVRLYLRAQLAKHIRRKARRDFNEMEYASSRCSVEVLKAKDILTDKEHFIWI